MANIVTSSIRDPKLNGRTYRVTSDEGLTAAYWYDPSTRCWVVYATDANGYQIGAADYVYTRADAESSAVEIVTRKSGEYRPAIRMDI